MLLAGPLILYGDATGVVTSRYPLTPALAPCLSRPLTQGPEGDATDEATEDSAWSESAWLSLTVVRTDASR